MIFFIYGTDHYRCQEKLTELKNGFILKRDKAGLNVVEIDDDKMPIEQFQQETLTTPFLGEKKMIVIRNTLANKKIGKELASFLKDNLHRIDNVICFIDLIDPEKAKTDRKNKLALTGELFKYLSKEKFIWEFNLLTNRESTNWIKKYVQDQEIKIKPKAIDELAIRSGNDLFQTVSEIKKLSAFKKDEEITADDVKLMVNFKFDDNIFNLVDAIGGKNKKLALRLISNQLKSGDAPLYILSMINRQFKIILSVKNNKATAAGLKLHPFVFQKAKTQSANFTTEKIVIILNELINVESGLKSGEKNPELLFDLLVAKNC